MMALATESHLKGRTGITAPDAEGNLCRLMIENDSVSLTALHQLAAERP